MSRTVHCVKLNKEAAGLVAPPYPGELGQRIFATICNEAWQLWLAHQTMLINEYRLTLSEPKARQFLEQEMEQFLFSDGSKRPAQYTPPTDTKST